MSDPVPPRVRDILALFESDLSDARFGDLDATALETLAEEVRDRARDVDAARAALDASHAALEEARAILSKRAEQALAYARVFAEEHEEVAARVEAIQDERGEPAAKPRRAKKKNGAEPELPFAARA
jgi:hypothetical protein